MITVLKHPESRKDWKIKFGRRLNSSDEIYKASVDIEIPNGDINTDSSKLNVYYLEWDETDITIWFENGTHNTTYKVTVSMVGTEKPAGRTRGIKDTYSFYVEVSNDIF